MNLILVDTPVRKFHLVEIEGEATLPVLYQLIGCEMIEGHPFPNIPGHWFYCDEEGTLQDPPLPSLMIECFPFPVFGRLLVFKAEGSRTVSPICTVSDVVSRIRFNV